ncbi:MAG: DUF58 domain-containing protein [Flavobacteriales bacterium]|nr:DUF58 domain-containing protein [Flavobacteriales bacterium]
MDVKDVLKKVRKIEIKTRRLSDHVFSGEYHSSFKGRGMTFSEVRAYQFGDDVRNIDWNVTAKTNSPHVKVFEEERELTMMLAVDVSGSEFFGTGDTSKRDVITEICATLAFSAMGNNDKIGLMLFSDKVELFIPPAKGRMHVLRIIRELIEFEPKNRLTDIGAAMEYLFGVMKKKAIVFLVSDFINAGYADALKIISRKHDMTGIRVYDPAEENLPDVGMVLMRNDETGRYVWANTSSRAVKQEYYQQYDRRVAYFEDTFRHSGAGTISTSTNDDYAKKLLGYFKNR